MATLIASPAGSVAPPPAMLRLLSDERLARLAAAGSEAAFAAIFQRHHEALHRYCHSILGNGHDAGDALQNTMIKALRALPGEQRQIALKPWLYRVAHNESISLLRSRRGHGELGTAAHVGDPAAETVVESRERMRDLATDLQELTEQQRGALLMRELGGLAFGEVAAALAISPAAAKQSVYEARCALQAMQEGRTMDCDLIRRTLSDGDGRTLRAKTMRGHLRACAGCRDFEAALRQRPAQLAALVPPLPLGLAGAMLHSALGSGAQGGGGLTAGLSAGGVAGPGGGGVVGASIGVGANAGGALSLAAAKIAAVAVVAGSVAGGAAYVAAPRDVAPRAITSSGTEQNAGNAAHGQTGRAGSLGFADPVATRAASDTTAAQRTTGAPAPRSPAGTANGPPSVGQAGHAGQGGQAGQAGQAGAGQRAGQAGQARRGTGRANGAAAGSRAPDRRQATRGSATGPTAAANRPASTKDAPAAATSRPVARKPAPATRAPAKPVTPATPGSTKSAPLAPSTPRGGPVTPPRTR